MQNRSSTRIEALYPASKVLANLKPAAVTANATRHLALRRLRPGDEVLRRVRRGLQAQARPSARRVPGLLSRGHHVRQHGYGDYAPLSCRTQYTGEVVSRLDELPSLSCRRYSRARADHRAQDDSRLLDFTRRNHDIISLWKQMKVSAEGPPSDGSSFPLCVLSLVLQERIFTIVLYSPVARASCGRASRCWAALASRRAQSR